jgi:hypothetical protein
MSPQDQFVRNYVLNMIARQTTACQRKACRPVQMKFAIPGYGACQSKQALLSRMDRPAGSRLEGVAYPVLHTARSDCCPSLLVTATRASVIQHGTPNDAATATPRPRGDRGRARGAPAVVAARRSVRAPACALQRARSSVRAPACALQRARSSVSSPHSPSACAIYANTGRTVRQGHGRSMGDGEIHRVDRRGVGV